MFIRFDEEKLQIIYKVILIITRVILKWIRINELVKIDSIKTSIVIVADKAI